MITQKNISKLVDILTIEEVLPQEVNYTVDYYMAAQVIMSYFTIEDIVKGGNESALISAIFFDGACTSDENLTKLGVSRATFYRKKSEYINMFRGIFKSSQYLELQNCLFNCQDSKCFEKIASVSKVETAFAKNLFYNKEKCAELFDLICSISKFELRDNEEV